MGEMMMRRAVVIVLLISIISTLILSGCEEKINNEGSYFNNIYFDGGGIFKLIVGNLTYITHKGEVVAAKVTMLFQNIADRTISANVSVVLYDKNDTILYSTSKQFYNYPPGYRDQSVLPANTVTYDGDDAYKVDHVSITVREIT